MRPSPNRPFRQLAWAFALVLGLAAPASAQPKQVPDFVLKPVTEASPSPWQVAGRVVFRRADKTSAPATGIEVFLTSTGGQVVDRGRTDGKGQYVLVAPQAGTYEVRVDQSSATRRRGMLLAPFKQIVTLQ